MLSCLHVHHFSKRQTLKLCPDIFVLNFTEMWYLVMYEDDNNIRVLAEDEISHIFPDEDAEDEVQPGDIVSAIWLPNGQYYDAKVLQKGSEFPFYMSIIKFTKPQCNASLCLKHSHEEFFLSFFCMLFPCHDLVAVLYSSFCSVPEISILPQRRFFSHFPPKKLS